MNIDPKTTLRTILATMGVTAFVVMAAHGYADAPRTASAKTLAVGVPEDPESPPTVTTEDVVAGPAVATKPAVRLNPPTTTAPAPRGLDGLPFAPQGLDGCAEMVFYMKQFGLPARFGDGGRHQLWVASDGLGWRESKCKNYVKTWCCYGYWQLHINLFLKDWKLGPLLRNECKIEGVSDIFGTAPLQKQKQACAARKLYDVSGYSPWRPL